jgi:Flp pilus assembly protein TadB
LEEKDVSTLLVLKLILVVAAAWIAWRVWSTVQQQRDRVQRRDPDAFEPMVRCRQCGVHLPRSAVSTQGLCGKCAST